MKTQLSTNIIPVGINHCQTGYKVASKNLHIPQSIAYFVINRCLLLVYLWPMLTYANFDLSVNQDYYLTTASLDNQLDYYTSLNSRLKYHNFYGSWFYGVEGVSSFFLNKSKQKYLSIPDLFFGYEFATDNNYIINVVLGRQKRSLSIVNNKRQSENFLLIQPEPWSVMDEIWGMGLWQSRMNWDYLSPEQQGLIGPFFTFEKSPVSVTLFLSGLFLPDHGPSVDITSEGKIDSDSRWFVPPLSNFVIFDRRIESLYWLEKPYLKNIVLNDSVLARLRIGDIHKTWVSFAYANKPMNQIYFTVDSKFSIDETAMNSTISYQANKHSLYTMDMGATDNNIGTIILSATKDYPEQPVVEKGGITPTLPSILWLSSHMQLNMHGMLFLQLARLDLIYSYTDPLVNKTSNETKNKVSQLQLDLPDTRFRVYRGAIISIQSEKLYFKNQYFSFGLNYWYSHTEEGGWLGSFIKWEITPDLTVESQVDIIGVNEDVQKNSSQRSGFFHTYKQNDRVQLKVSYAIQ